MKNISDIFKPIIVVTVTFAVPAVLLTALFHESLRHNPTQQYHEALVTIYPKQFSLKRFDSGAVPRIGLQKLNQSSDLKGSLCWMGDRIKSDGIRLSNHAPIIKKLDLEGNVIQDKKMQLPDYTSSAYFVGCPKFKGRKDKTYFRVYKSGEDYSVYELYLLNFPKSTARSQNFSIIPLDDFRVAPDGNAIAYADAPPYNSTPYTLNVFNGQQRTVAMDQPSEGFSWTSDNHLLYAAFPKKTDYTRNFGYPDVYDNNLKGISKVVKYGGYRPLFDAKKHWLAYTGPDITLSESQKSSEDLKFSRRVISKTALFAFDVQKKKEFFVKRIYESYPDVVWVDQDLYVIENYYCQLAEVSMQLGVGNSPLFRRSISEATVWQEQQCL